MRNHPLRRPPLIRTTSLLLAAAQPQRNEKTRDNPKDQRSIRAGRQTETSQCYSLPPRKGNFSAPQEGCLEIFNVVPPSHSFLTSSQANFTNPGRGLTRYVLHEIPRKTLLHTRRIVGAAKTAAQAASWISSTCDLCCFCKVRPSASFFPTCAYAHAVRFALHPSGYRSAVKASEEYASVARRELDNDEPSVDTLQALLLLVLAFTAAGKGKKAYMLMSTIPITVPLPNSRLTGS